MVLFPRGNVIITGRGISAVMTVERVDNRHRCFRSVFDTRGNLVQRSRHHRDAVARRC